MANALLNRRTVIAGLAATVAAPRAAQAQAWKPTTTVRMIVPFSAGGISDILGRLIGSHMQQRWGQPVVVENRTGAGGTILNSGAITGGSLFALLRQSVEKAKPARP